MNIDSLVERATILLEQNRTKEARAELEKALALDPSEPGVLLLLSECYIADSKGEKAIKFAKQAVELDPEEGVYLYVLARAYIVADDSKNAKQAIDSALRLEPTDADFNFVRGNLDFDDKNWQQALNWAEKGLEHEADNINCLNLRNMALVKLNRLDEANEAINYALSQEPNNSFSQTNKGFNQLELGNYDEAVTHFREALQQDPESEYAKEGLKEAIRGKNILYRGVLRYFLFMQKLSNKAQWVVIIGLYVGYRILNKLAKSIPEIAPFVMPVLIAYVVFAFSSWIGHPVANLALRFHPLGKLALTKDEKLASKYSSKSTSYMCGLLCCLLLI